MRFLAVLLTMLAVVGCAVVEPGRPAVSLSAPGGEIARPVQGAELTPGRTYRFDDLLPGSLHLDIDVDTAGVVAQSVPAVVALHDEGSPWSGVLELFPSDDVSLWADPFDHYTADGAFDVTTAVVEVDPGGTLAALAGLPFVDVVVPARPVTAAGTTATAVDVRVQDLPPEADSCAAGGPRCAVLLLTFAGYGTLVESGRSLRFMEFELPTGRVLAVQNLGDPRSERLLRSARFVEIGLPAALSPARPLPYTIQALPPDTAYGAVLEDIGLGVTFAVGRVPTIASAICLCVGALHADLPADLQELTPFGYSSSTEQVIGFVTPTADQFVPDPGVDPRVVGPAAFDRSVPADTGTPDGIVGVIAAQPWAEILAGPDDTVVGGHPARTIDVRLRPGTGSVPCTLSRPEDGLCAVLEYQRSYPVMSQLSDRVLRVSQVDVGGRPITVVTGVDEAGLLFAESLRLVELGP